MNRSRKINSTILAIPLLAFLCNCGGPEARIQQYMARAEQHLAEGRLEEATIDAKRVLVIEATHGPANSLLQKIGNRKSSASITTAELFAKAKAFLLASEFESARDSLEKVLQRDPENRLAKNNLAVLLANHFSDTSDLERARQLVAGFESSDDPRLLNTAGWVRVRQNEATEGIVLIKKSLAIDPDIAEHHYHLGIAYLQLGETGKARRSLSSATDNIRGKSYEQWHSALKAAFDKIDEI